LQACFVMIMQFVQHS